MAVRSTVLRISFLSLCVLISAWILRSGLPASELISIKITDWVDPKDTSGEFKRGASAFRNFISSKPGAQYPPEKGRYHLYVSYACPWGKYATLHTYQPDFPSELGNLDPITSSFTELESGGWRFVTPDESLPGENVRPDPLHPGYSHLRDIYFAVDPDYKGRFTVPTLYDTKTKTIVSNESSEIIRMLYHEFDSILPEQYAKVDLFPPNLQKDIEATNEWTYSDINNGVYKSGFATTEDAYTKAVTQLFKSLDRVEEHLSQPEHQPFYWGEQLTEADVRLFTTIIRFDAVYVQHFKCNIRDIRSGYPAIHRWVRNLYWHVPAFHETTEFEHIKNHYTKSHKQINQFSITPVGPIPNILPLDQEVPAAMHEREVGEKRGKVLSR
ncbi:MAG: hypothetical protein Q9227_007706 [Pyrenula ochraceoflavens]